MKKKRGLNQDHIWGYLMVSPTIIGLLVLNVYPFLQTIYLSFTNAKVFGAHKFVGLSNYTKMIASEEFLRATWNTILFCILTVPIGVFLALIIAILLNAKIKGKVVFRAIFFLPMVVAPAAVAMVWKWMFNSEYGIINTVFNANVDWITNFLVFRTYPRATMRRPAWTGAIRCSSSGILRCLWYRLRCSWF